MENYNEFSPIEQAAMLQSPVHETHVHQNFMSDSNFITKIETANNDGGCGRPVITTEPVLAECTPAATDVNTAVTKAIAAAGGNIFDNIFTKEHQELLKNINKECSVDELIDLRSNLMIANRMQK